MEISDIFKRAVANFYKDGELDKTLNNIMKNENLMYRVKEKAEAKRLKEHFDSITEKGANIEDIPLIPLVNMINSAEVYKDIIFYMIAEGYKEEANE